MSTPEEKARKRMRIKSHVTKDLHTKKYRQRVKEDKKKRIDVTKLSHADLIKLIQERSDESD